MSASQQISHLFVVWTKVIEIRFIYHLRNQLDKGNLERKKKNQEKLKRIEIWDMKNQMEKSSSIYKFIEVTIAITIVVTTPIRINFDSSFL